MLRPQQRGLLGVEPWPTRGSRSGQLPRLSSLSRFPELSTPAAASSAGSTTTFPPPRLKRPTAPRPRPEQAPLCRENWKGAVEALLWARSTRSAPLGLKKGPAGSAIKLAAVGGAVRSRCEPAWSLRNPPICRTFPARARSSRLFGLAEPASSLPVLSAGCDSEGGQPGSPSSWQPSALI